MFDFVWLVNLNFKFDVFRNRFGGGVGVRLFLFLRGVSVFEEALVKFSFRLYRFFIGYRGFLDICW